MNAQDMVREFHTLFGLPIRTEPTTVLSPGESELRMNLLDEEVVEYFDAVYDDDIVEIADGLADIVYIAFGTALVYGINLNAVLEEVHRSNMLKIWDDGKVHYREDGKVLKPPYWEPPNIAEVLAR